MFFFSFLCFGHYFPEHSKSITSWLKIANVRCLLLKLPKPSHYGTRKAPSHRGYRVKPHVAPWSTPQMVTCNINEQGANQMEVPTFVP